MHYGQLAAGKVSLFKKKKSNLSTTYQPGLGFGHSLCCPLSRLTPLMKSVYQSNISYFICSLMTRNISKPQIVYNLKNGAGSRVDI